MQQPSWQCRNLLHWSVINPCNKLADGKHLLTKLESFSRWDEVEEVHQPWQEDQGEGLEGAK
jgi:hypothetical protein